MKTPFVKRQTTPRSGFSSFFRFCGPGVGGVQERALVSFPYGGADRTCLHTRIAALSPLQQRWQRDVWIALYGLETSLSPHTVLRNEEAARVPCASEVQHDLAVLTPDTDVHGAGMQVAAAVKWVLVGAAAHS